MKKIAPLLLGLLAFTWGSSFILMKLGMTDPEGRELFSSSEVAAMRMSIAAIALLPFAVWHFRSFPKNRLLPLLVIGLFGNAIPAFLFTAAEEKVAPSLAGMLNSTTPIFTVLIAVLIFRNKFLPVNYLGVLIGFMGSAGLVLANGLEQAESEIGYSLLIPLATLCYAISVNTTRQYMSNVNSIAVASISLVMTGIPITIYLFTTDVAGKLSTNPHAPAGLFYILLLALVGTALAVVLFNYLIKITNALYASAVTYLIPVTAIFWGLLFNEQVNLFHFVFMAVILGGVYLINLKKKPVLAEKILTERS